MDIYITGVAETPLGEVTDHSELAMLAIAANDALDEAGLSFDDVDGLFVNYMGEQGTVQVAEYLGIAPEYVDSTDLGGAAFTSFVNHACAAVRSGVCEVALIAYASRQRSRKLRSLESLGGPVPVLTEQFQAPYDLPLPLGHYAMMAARHMYEFGTTQEQLAEVAVAARAWATLNPNAWHREAITIEDVLESPMICDPLHKLDCCLITDGGGAVVLTTKTRAQSASKRPIRVAGAAEAQSHWHLSQMPDLTRTSGEVSGPKAFQAAGITPADVDVFEVYDSFTITVIMALEDLGFVSKGEGGDYVATGALRPGGALPAMTSGGGLSYNHPGALGVLLLVEAVRQLRHEAGARQVPGAEVGVAHGVGGMYSATGTVVLTRE